MIMFALTLLEAIFAFVEGNEDSAMASNSNIALVGNLLLHYLFDLRYYILRPK